MRRGLVWLAAAIFMATAALADEAHFWVPTGVAARVEVGARSGLHVGVEAVENGALVTVSHEAQALAGAPPYPLPSPAGSPDAEYLQVPEHFSLPPEVASLVRSATDSVELLTNVVGFVSQRVALVEQDTGSQDAASVLVRRAGRCSGRANLAVGLLRAAGVPARAVSGVLIGEDGPRWHRWGEARLASLGWVGFDPGSSVGMVSVRHLPLRGAGEGTKLDGVRIAHIEEQIYSALPVVAGLRVVPVGGITVHCQAPRDVTEFTAVLLGPDGSRWSRRGRGEVRFSGLLPGRYRLYWWGSERRGSLRMELGRSDEVRLQLAREEVGS